MRRETKGREQGAGEVKGRRGGKRYAATVTAFLLAAFALGGCGSETPGGCGGKTPGGPPDDTPWNNGHCAILETEKGYYSNLMYPQNLRFYEKGTDTEIYLCGKPECPHDGRESCTATYKKLATVNTVLYDGALYILATEETDTATGYSLYRAALDGSAIDKVGEVFRADRISEDMLKYNPNTTTGEPSAFIIHRGYAYIPFYLLCQKQPFPSLLGGGIMRMDLKTGQTEEIYTMKRMDSPYPWYLSGWGDYVYYYCYENKGGAGRLGKYYRYDTRDGSVTDISEHETLLREQQEGFDRNVVAVAEDTLYVCIWNRCEEEKDGFWWEIHAYDGETMEDRGFLFGGARESSLFRLVPYQDKLFLYCEDRIEVYSKKGEKLGETAYDFPGRRSGELSYFPMEGDFFLRISQDRVYAVLKEGLYKDYYSIFFDETDCEVYACAIQDILDGTAEWSRVYTVKSQLGLTGKAYDGAIREGGMIRFNVADPSRF